MPPSNKRQRQREREQLAKQAAAEAEKKAQQQRTLFTIGGLVVLVIVLALAYSIFGSSDSKDETTTAPGGNETASIDDDSGFVPETEEPTNNADPIECPATDGSATQILDFPALPPDCLEPGATYEAIFDTTEGEIRVALDVDKTPITANNFIYLSRYGYYDNTDLFRSNTGIDIIQGGSPHTNTNSDPGPGYTIPDEGNQDWTYTPGDLVMARTAAPNSASAQFFFATGPGTADLNGQGTYVVFGHVTEGMETLDTMMANHVDGSQPGEGAPDPIPVIRSITIVQS